MNLFKIKTQSKHESSVLKLYEIGLQKISEEKFQSALSDFQSCELILESEVSEINPYLVLGIYHNASLCCQRLQSYEQTVDYIASTVRKCNDILSQSLNIDLIQYKILRMLQMCAALSVNSQHKSSLSASKKTLNEINQLFGILASVIEKNIKSDKLIAGKTRENEGSSRLSKIIEKVILNDFEKPVVVHGQEWLSSYNMGDIMLIQSFNLSDWLKVRISKSLISMKTIFISICLIISCQFTIATESRLATDSKRKSESITLQGKEWHEQAIEMCKCFLPSTCPLFLHIFSSYKKHYGIKRKLEAKKSILVPLKRIYMKRNSEKTRAISEKNNNRTMNQNNKISPTRKLTPNTRTLSSRNRVNKLQTNVRYTEPNSQPKSSLATKFGSESILKECLRVQTEHRESSSSSSSPKSESINCKIYSAEEFRSNFIMTSKLLYGENSDSEDKNEENLTKREKTLSRNEMSKISLIQVNPDAKSKGFYS